MIVSLVMLVVAKMMVIEMEVVEMMVLEMAVVEMAVVEVWCGKYVALIWFYLEVHNNQNVWSWVRRPTPLWTVFLYSQ